MPRVFEAKKKSSRFISGLAFLGAFFLTNSAQSVEIAKETILKFKKIPSKVKIRGDTLFISGPINYCDLMALGLGGDFECNQITRSTLGNATRFVSNATDTFFSDQGGALKKVKKIVLNSTGGHVSVAQKIIAQFKGRNIETEVPSGGVCASACTLIYQIGTRRTAAPDALFMFHKVRYAFDQKAWDCGWESSEYYQEYVAETKKTFDELVKFHGLKQSLVDKVLRSKKDVWLTAQESMQFGVVQKLKNSDKN